MIFAQEEQQERRRGIFDEEAGHQFGFRFQQVEGRAVGFRQGRDEEDHQHREQDGEDVPVREAPARPRSACASHDVGEVQRAGEQQHRDHHKADRDFVGHHLGRGAQRRQEGVFRVGGPARHDDAVDAERRHREEIENADIDVGDDPAVVERDHRPGGEGQRHADQRRQQEDHLVGAGRDDHFLEQEFERVGDGLQQAEGADHIGAAAHLHRRPDLAVGQDARRRPQHQHQADRQQDEHDLAERTRPSHRAVRDVCKKWDQRHRLLRRHLAACRCTNSWLHLAMVSLARAIGLVR